MNFFFDIDGTLYEPRVGVRASTKLALSKLKEAGHNVCIATGRSYIGAKDIAEELQVDYLICDGGNSLYHEGKKIYSGGLSKEKYREYMEIAKQHGISYILVDDHHYYGEKRMMGFEKVHPWIDFQGNKAIEDIDVAKIAFDVNEAEAKILEKELDVNTLLFDEVMCLVSDPNNKAEGIMECTKHLSGGTIVVFGDSMNDITMFHVADISVCMGQAGEAVKKEATFVTKNVEDDGIYYACLSQGWIKE